MRVLKVRHFLTATAFFVCLAVFLCACGKGADDASTTELVVTSPWSEAQVFTLPSEAPTGVKEEKQADTEQTDVVLNRIKAARAVYGMFTETRPQLDKTDKIEVEQGLFAYRVSEPQFATMEKLHAYLNGYFSDDISQRLLNIGIFTEIDGKLYAIDAAMRPPQSADLQVKVTEKTDTTERYRLTVKGEAEKTYDFVYAKQEDGKWVFTHFEAY